MKYLNTQNTDDTLPLLKLKNFLESNTNNNEVEVATNDTFNEIEDILNTEEPAEIESKKIRKIYSNTYDYDINHLTKLL